MPKAAPLIEMTPMNFEALSKKFAGSRGHMLVAMNQALRRAGQMLTPKLKDKTPVGATGKLRSSTVFQVLGKAEDMSVEIRQSASSSKGFAYGVAVRHGTKPHFPPIDALVPWVRKVLGIGPERVRQVAFLVARKISREGTKPQPYHIEVLDDNLTKVKSIMKAGAVDFVTIVSDVPEVKF